MIDLEKQKWVIEFAEDTIITPAKQAEILALMETDKAKNAATRDILKQVILMATGVFFSVSHNYKILLKDK